MAIQGRGAGRPDAAARPGLDEEEMMVRLPDAAGQVRNVPVRVLRGIFAGIGRLLLAADRVRTEEVTTEKVTTEEVSSEQAVSSEQYDPPTSPGRASGENGEPEGGKQPEPTKFRSLDSTGNVRILAPGEVSLPIPGYDGLSVPSLRARLRSLNASQLRVLLEYEKSHEGRHDVVIMFERRITKLESPAIKAAGPDAS
jgi:hypothetical protein